MLMVTLDLLNSLIFEHEPYEIQNTRYPFNRFIAF